MRSSTTLLNHGRTTYCMELLRRSPTLNGSAVAEQGVQEEEGWERKGREGDDMWALLYFFSFFTTCLSCGRHVSKNRSQNH